MPIITVDNNVTLADTRYNISMTRYVDGSGYICIETTRHGREKLYFSNRVDALSKINLLKEQIEKLFKISME